MASCNATLRHGGGEGSQTEPAKIGTAAPYFPKIPFETSHLPFGNAIIVSNSVESVTFLLKVFKRNFLYFHFKIGSIGRMVSPAARLRPRGDGHREAQGGETETEALRAEDIKESVV